MSHLRPHHLGHTSHGQVISTMCFAGVGLWCLGTAVQGADGPQVFLALCGLCSLAGALRFPLARALGRFLR